MTQTIQGLLLRKGAPLVEAVISIIESPEPMPDLGYLTDEAGSFQLHLPPGQYRIHIQAQGSSQEETLFVPDESRQMPIKWTIEWVD